MDPRKKIESVEYKRVPEYNTFTNDEVIHVDDPSLRIANTDLLRYIENEIITLTPQLSEEKTGGKLYFAKGALKSLLCLFAAGLGLPWRDASYEAGKIFKSDSLKEIFGQLFG